MYATKQPTLRIKQADLKCKNGCGFFGNAEWEGKFSNFKQILLRFKYNALLKVTVQNVIEIICKSKEKETPAMKRRNIVKLEYRVFQSSKKRKGNK